MPLLVHGEVTDPEVDVFDKEKVFLDQVLIPVTQRFPRLKIVFEHITTTRGCGIRDRRAGQYRRHHYRSPSATQPQCHVSRRHSTTSLLPSRIEARNSSPETDRGRDQRQPEVFSRYRQCSSFEVSKGTCLRLRRHLYRSCGDRALCRSLRTGGRTGQIGGVRKLPWC